MARKERRAWHNFADPNLKGDASPNNKPVWRVLDRCRTAQFFAHEINGEERAIAVVECRGDDFVHEQVRRIVGTSIAMAYGWLPPDFFDVATRPDVFIETPLAPPNHMYLAGTRFHFDELTSKGSRLFDELLELGGRGEDYVAEFRRSMLDKCFEKSVVKSEERWLVEMRDTITPRIRQALEDVTISIDGSKQKGQQGMALDGAVTSKMKSMPPVYDKSLAFLRDITANGQWPTTSVARSKVIKDTETAEDESESTTILQSGSFTIINPHFHNGILLDEEKSGIRVPLANKVFPHLADVIFELEEMLSLEMSESEKKVTTRRPASSHCAVNRNAQFTPHVDSGRGLGQSLSMIVGLGDYTGGGLFIEGECHDIRYESLEFDGWKERHWTAVSDCLDSLCHFISSFFSFLFWNICVSACRHFLGSGSRWYGSLLR